MIGCKLSRDVEALRVPEPDCGRTGERLIGHNLALDKVGKILDDCPRLPPRYTGWYVAVRRKEDGTWEPVGCVYDGDEDEESLALLEERWDLMLPIPDPEDLPEWDGF